MLIRHPTSGLYWSVNDTSEIVLSETGSRYTFEAFPDVPNTSYLKNTETGASVYRSHLNTLMERDHPNIPPHQMLWTILDGTIRQVHREYVDGDLSFVESTSTQWIIDDEDVPVDPEMAKVEESLNQTVADVFAPETPAPEPEPVVETPEPVVETPAPEPEPVVETPEPEPVVETPAPEPEPVVETPEPVVEEDVPVKRGSALIEEALTAPPPAQEEPAKVEDEEPSV